MAISNWRDPVRSSPFRSRHKRCLPTARRRPPARRADTRRGYAGRPDIKPSGMEQGTTPKPRDKHAGRRSRGKVMPRVRRLGDSCSGGGARGARFKGYEAGDRRQHLEAAGDAAADRRTRCIPCRSRDVLRAGLQTAGWITVDDTGARHKAATASARRSATTTSPGSAPPAARAD